MPFNRKIYYFSFGAVSGGWGRRMRRIVFSSLLSKRKVMLFQNMLLGFFVGLGLMGLHCLWCEPVHNYTLILFKVILNWRQLREALVILPPKSPDFFLPCAMLANMKVLDWTVGDPYPCISLFCNPEYFITFCASTY